MSIAAEKANAARWVHSKVGAGLTDSQAAEWWGILEDRLEDCRSNGSRELCVIEWQREVGERLAVRVAHSPLEETT